MVYWLKQKSTALYLIELTLVYTLPLMFFGELEVSYGECFPAVFRMTQTTIKTRWALLWLYYTDIELRLMFVASIIHKFI